jgi:AraC-like DNA-binding protein
LHYVVSGKGYVWVRGKAIALRAGGCFFFAPGEPMHYQAEWDEPWTYRWAAFTGTHAEQILDEFVSATDASVIQFSPNLQIVAHFDTLLTTLGNWTDGSALIATGLLQTAIGALIADAPTGTRRGAHPVDYVGAAAEFIDLNFQRSIQVSDVAQRVGIDRSHLSRLFRAARGGTVRDYLIERRIGRARELLVETTLSIQAVASSVGYDSYVVFQRRFAERVGMTPTAWRLTGQQKQI